MQDTRSAPAIVLVGLNTRLSTALGLVVERAGYRVNEAKTPAIARAVLAASRHIAAACRCTELSEDGQLPFTE